MLYTNLIVFPSRCSHRISFRFDPDKTFELQSRHDLGGDIKMDSVCSKLALVGAK